MKWTTTINYWFLGIPLSCFLMFYMKMGIKGLWWGPTLAVAMNYACYSYHYNKCDWQAIADE
jgi:Na+-driven multidrug efflux pump